MNKLFQRFDAALNKLFQELRLKYNATFRKVDITPQTYRVGGRVWHRFKIERVYFSGSRFPVAYRSKLEDAIEIADKFLGGNGHIVIKGKRK